jgi:stearoyl-CoA desaturase (delta-9 desaturase)
MLYESTIFCQYCIRENPDQHTYERQSGGGTLATTTARKYRQDQPRDWKDFNATTFAVIAALHVAACAGVLWHVLTRTWPSLPVMITALMMYGATTLGITFSYHRGHTHGGFKAQAWVDVILIGFGAMALQGSAIGWIDNHRKHHVYTDRPGDPHSPYQYRGLKGIGWAHVGWIWYDGSSAPKRVTKSKILRWQQKNYVFFVIATFLVPTLVGLTTGGVRGGVDGLLIAGFLRIVLQLNASWSVNSIGHIVGRRVEVIRRRPNSAGYDTEETVFPSDGSTNIWWLGLVTMGESYHAMHHLEPTCAYHGWNWWDLDPTKWFIMGLEGLGLIREVSKPPPHVRLVTSPKVNLDLKVDSFVNKGAVILLA